MKNIFTSFFVLLISFSGIANAQSFILNGTLPSSEYNGKPIYVQVIDNESGDYKTIDTITITGDKFILKSDAEAPTVQFISMDDMYRPLPFVKEQGEISLVFDSKLQPTLHGSPLNDKLQQFIHKRNEIGQKMELISNEYRDAKSAGVLMEAFEEEISERYDALSGEMAQMTFDFAKDNLSNILGQYIFIECGMSFSANQLNELFSALNPALLANPKVKKLNKWAEALNAIQIGNSFIDLTGKSPDGTVISLSDYAGKGKVVLVDFWASWCPPCRKEMPNVVKAYQEYKDKGFEIVGISLDDNADAWKKGISGLHITWPQMSDLKGWKSDLSLAYAVNSIPQTFLLDKEGKIIAHNLRGESLTKKLSELLD